MIKNGIEVMKPRVFRNDLGNVMELRGGTFIVQQDHPLEVGVWGDGEYGPEHARLQFYVREGTCHDVFRVTSKQAKAGKGYKESERAIFGIARDIAPLISSQSHTELIQSWIANCLRTHTTCGRSDASLFPSRLLDIHPCRGSSVALVETQQSNFSQETPLYATLSHCWGSTQFVKTTLTNFVSFKAGIPFAALPRTFRDAISVARELSIGYIWIDSLCIIQDSPEDWKNESARMAAVYSNPYLNIAATGASDSSEAFLSSCSPNYGSTPCHSAGISREGGREGDEVLVRATLKSVHQLYSTPTKNITLNPESVEMFEAPLLDRAWVFQERYLAPRTLHFYSTELIMECRSGLRCECTGLDTFSSNPLRNFEDISFISWYRVVEEFSKLELTYQSDRLEALMGVAKVF